MVAMSFGGGARLSHCEKSDYERFPVAEIDPALSAQGPRAPNF